MLKVLRYPKLNAVLLGLAQGVPQGLSLPSDAAFASPSFDQNLWLLACLGLVVPPTLVALNQLRNRPEPLWWSKLNEFVDPYQMMFWGGLSLAVCGAYALRTAGASGGYAVVAFCGASAVGFLAGGFVDRWLKRRHAGNAI